MPRPFRKGIACHGSMSVCPFGPELFVDLNNDVHSADTPKIIGLFSGSCCFL